MTVKTEINETDGALKILREVGKALTSTLELDSVLGVIMDMIATLYKPSDWSLLMVDEDTNELYFAVAVGKAAENLMDLRLKIGEGVAGWVAMHGEPVVITDAYRDERFAKWVDGDSGFKTDSIVCVPLISKGRTMGVIELVNFSSSFKERERLELLEAMADFAAIAIENARYVNRVKELTIIDDCTGLYNARHMHDLIDAEISRANREGGNFSLVFLDLDHFKEVNDTSGHLVGSRLLAEIGKVLKSQLRAMDWAVRYGGDEFVVILPHTNRDQAMIVARRLRKALNETTFFTREELNIKVTASFGVASYPEDAGTKEEILKLSDQAMYKVKDTTRDGVRSAAGETFADD